MSEKLDKRLHAYRPDLADEALASHVNAKDFVKPKPAVIGVPFANLHSEPDLASGMDTQLVMGDRVNVFERKNGWAWVQAQADGYVGYTKTGNVRRLAKEEPTHYISAVRSFSYSEPDMKTPGAIALSLGALIIVKGQAITRGTKYLFLNDGRYVVAAHTLPIDEHASDYVSVAELLMYTPYLWGGTTSFGIDCSGLVQLAMRIAGKSVLRDTDMQEKTIGAELGFAAMDGGLKRGDLIFWKGHVGIMKNATTLIHANGHSMTVAVEKLENALERIGYLYGFPTTIRRP